MNGEKIVSEQENIEQQMKNTMLNAINNNYNIVQIHCKPEATLQLLDVKILANPAPEVLAYMLQGLCYSSPDIANILHVYSQQALRYYEQQKLITVPQTGIITGV